MRKIIFILLVLFLGCSSNSKFENYEPKDFREIKLPEEIGNVKFEYSGLTIFENNLILLPQYPFSSENDSIGYFFSIPLQRIRNYLKKNEYFIPIEVDSIKINLLELQQFNSSGSGLEAIEIDEKGNVYISIESYSFKKGFADAYFFQGKFSADRKSIKFDKNSIIQIPSVNHLPNLSYESLVKYGNDILFIYEANGQNISNNHKTYKWNLEQQKFSEILFEPIEYRITDVAKQSDSTFFALNYFWPGERELLKPSCDSLGLLKNESRVSCFQKSVERIVKFIVTNEAINIDYSFQPINFRISKEGSTNWEGLAYHKELGYFVISDTYPRTILGIIPNNK
jgi:hypothetical protein